MAEAKPIIPTVHPELLAAQLDPQIRRYQRELMRREMEALRIYEPLKVQAAFHASTVNERILRGSNRGGKTLPACVEVARAVTAQDPFDKFPKENGRCLIVGKDEYQLAETLYRKLFVRGAFRTIKDLTTGKLRAYRPWDPMDAAREKETRPAQPLIPSRFITERSWKNKKAHVPGTIRLTTGWEMSFHTAGSPPPTGVDVDLILFDEEITGLDWYAECAARLMDRGGKFIWSATPQNATVDLFDLSKRAADPLDTDVAEFFIDIAANPHMSEREKEKLKAKYKNKPDDYKIRIEGQFAILGYLVYPNFSMSHELHGCEPFPIPDDWNRVMVVDPGRQVCAVQFWAVPHPRHPRADQRFLYDELYIQNCDAQRFAERVAAAINTNQMTEFIIDPSAAKHEVAGGQTIMAQYSAQLERRRVQSARTGYGFTLGANAILPGIERVSGWMAVQPDTYRPKLQIFDGRCPNFLEEIERYHRKRIKGVFTDEPDGRNDHHMDALRYFVMRDPPWTEPPKLQKPESYVMRHMRERHERRTAQAGPRGIWVGPTSGRMTA